MIRFARSKGLCQASHLSNAGGGGAFAVPSHNFNSNLYNSSRCAKFGKGKQFNDRNVPILCTFRRGRLKNTVIKIQRLKYFVHNVNIIINMFRSC